MITSPLSFFLKGSKAAFCFCKYQLFNFIFVFLLLLVKKIKDSAAGTPKTDPCYCLKLSIFFPESNNTVRQRNLNFLALLETFPLKLPSIDLCIPSGNDSHQLDLEKNGKAPIIASLLLSYMVLMWSIQITSIHLLQEILPQILPGWCSPRNSPKKGEYKT